jgi:hypothetical protein
MVATHRDAQSAQPDHYECLNCGTVITRAARGGRGPDRRDDEA